MASDRAPLHYVLTPSFGPSLPDLRLDKPQKLTGSANAWDARTFTLPPLLPPHVSCLVSPRKDPKQVIPRCAHISLGHPFHTESCPQSMPG